VRSATRSYALRHIERALAQGQPSQSALRQLQDFLEEDERSPLLLLGMRGERAMVDRVFEAVQSGDISKREILDMRRWGAPTDIDWKDTLRLLSGISLSDDRAALLRYMTDYVEVAKLPVEDQRPRIDELEVRKTQLPRLARWFLPSISKVAESFCRTQAQERCAIVMLAAERFRQAHGRWPERLEELAPGELDRVPPDPYDGQPLRFRHDSHGVAIYSIGPEAKDHGGNLTRANAGKNADIGYRLWNVAERRQPPLNPGVGPPNPHTVEEP
jgi:hypothetical protein